MSICPLCEHVQPAGDVCDVCGRPLEREPGLAGAVPPLDGLEATAIEDVGPLDVPPLEGLESPPLAAPEPHDPGLHEPELHEPEPPAPSWLEPTGASRVEVEATPLAGLEPTAPDALDAPTPVPAVAICRYCRTPALPGARRCERCGMRLPGIEAERPAPAPEDVRLCSCGAPVTRALCPACGARIPDLPEG